MGGYPSEVGQTWDYPLVLPSSKHIPSGYTHSAQRNYKTAAAYLENAARNLRLYDNLCKVLKILRRDGIPVIVLKGAHLAELVYGNRALRFMGDLDLLVQKDDVMRVDALLIEMGCTPTVHNRIVERITMNLSM